MPDEKKIQIIRTHDEFYAKIDPYAPPKDSFIHIGKYILKYKNKMLRNISIADIGCATGAFPYYLTQLLPDDKIVGYEYLNSLVDLGKKYYPNIPIEQASVLEQNSIGKSSFEIVTLLGVLSIFDDIEPVISNLIHWTKPGGKIFIHGMFNPWDIDVFIKYRRSQDYKKDEYETGWNIISQNTICKLLLERGAKNIQFHEFNISVDLEINSCDPLRSWTEKLEGGKKQIINGLWIKQPQYILEVDV